MFCFAEPSYALGSRLPVDIPSRTMLAAASGVIPAPAGLTTGHAKYTASGFSSLVPKAELLTALHSTADSQHGIPALTLILRLEHRNPACRQHMAIACVSETWVNDTRAIPRNLKTPCGNGNLNPTKIIKRCRQPRLEPPGRTVPCR